MKKNILVIISLVISIFAVNLTLAVEKEEIPDKVKDELLEIPDQSSESKKRTKEYESFLNLITDTFGSYDEFQKIGSYYFKDEENNIIIIQLSKNSPEVSSFKNKLQTLSLDKNSMLKFEFVNSKYSKVELKAYLEEIGEIVFNNTIQAGGMVAINDVQQNIEVRANIPEEIKEELIKRYGDLIQFKPPFEPLAPLSGFKADDTQLRDRDYR